MATFTQSTVSGAGAPFSYRTYYNAVASFATHRQAEGDSSSQTVGQSRIAISTGGNVSRLSRNCMGFDMSIPTYFPTKYPVISSASLFMYCAGKTVDTAIWPTAAGRGVGICNLLDSYIGTSLTNGNYSAVRRNGFFEMATRLPDTSISASSWTEFEFNSSGIAYLNTVYSKTDNPGYAHFAAVLGGDIDNTSPGGVFNDTINYEWAGTADGAHYPYLSITYEPQVQINIGDAWKTVESVQINVGDVWKDVDNLNINVGDDWKDRE